MPPHYSTLRRWELNFSKLYIVARTDLTEMQGVHEAAVTPHG